MPGVARLNAGSIFLLTLQACWFPVFFFSASTVSAADLADAMNRYRSGEYDSCATLCQEAIDAGEFSETWRILKIQSEMACGRYPAARATLDAALERFSVSVRTRWLGATLCRLSGDEPRAQELLKEIDQLVSGAAWRYSDPASRVTLGHFYLQRGIDAKQVLEATFSYVKRQQPDFAEAYLAAGQLALEKHDYALAAEEFQKALKIDATDPDLLFGLARAFEPSDAEQAEAFLKKALERNPRHADSLLFLAESHIDAERYNEAREVIRQVLDVNPLEPRAWALQAVLAHLATDPRTELVARTMGLGWWPKNPQVDHLIGLKLSQKYRFREGATYQRRALAFDPDYQPARIQLSQDLLRLGDEEEGWQLAEQVLQRDGYQVVAHNLATLRDHLQGFTTLTADGFVVRMDPREARIYGPQVLELLRDAREKLTKKYEIELDRPVLVEIFPEQQDFAIRTFGLPGGDGFLGVCFGNVVTANSPASQGASPSNWKSVLWHEFCHVVTLNKTRNVMPRWLSEGISVYEERQANPRWGQWLTPRYREMLLSDELTPVSQLSGAFLNPPSPAHLQFAYYQSSLVVEFLIERYGFETLRRVLTDIGAGMPVNESLGRYAGSIQALDQEFADYAREFARRLGKDVDWSPAEIKPGADLLEIAAWLKEHPQNYEGLKLLGATLIAQENWQAAREPLERLVKLFPDDRSADSAQAMLAEVYRRLNDAAAERAVLKKLAETSSDALPACLRLAELAADEEDWAALWEYAEQAAAINPLQPAVQRHLALAAEKLGKDQTAIHALRALLVLAPLDTVDAHYRLACLLQTAGDRKRAKRHVLMALEEAPRYRDGHRKLQELVALEKEDAAKSRPAENSQPAAQPTTDKPPADKPPADKPPADKPPADKPPAEDPAADKPAAEASSAKGPAAEEPASETSDQPGSSNDRPQTPATTPGAPPARGETPGRGSS